MVKNSFYKYYELHTTYGPLYIYEKYKGIDNDGFKREIPEIHEFFTGEEAVRGYDNITFMNGKSKFLMEDRNYEGLVREEYFHELEPYSFLEKVEHILNDQEKLTTEKRHVYSIFEFAANKVKGNYDYSKDHVKTKDEKNKESELVLKKYLK